MWRHRLFVYICVCFPISGMIWTSSDRFCNFSASIYGLCRQCSTQAYMALVTNALPVIIKEYLGNAILVGNIAAKGILPAVYY